MDPMTALQSEITHNDVFAVTLPCGCITRFGSEQSDTVCVARHFCAWRPHDLTLVHMVQADQQC